MTIHDLTLREKIGQTAIFRHDLLPFIQDPDEYFAKNPIGASWVMGHDRTVYRAIEEKRGNPDCAGYKDEMHLNYINLINSHNRIPVLPVMDANDGIRANKFEGHATLPFAAGLGAANDPDLAFRYAEAIGKDLRSIGFRWLWSPVVDNAGVFQNYRSMTCDPERNGILLKAFIEGLHAAGVAGGAKHFPGADPYEYRDSHFCTASYSQSLTYWEQTQMPQFQACIDAGIDSIMIGHKTFRAVDDTRVNGALLPCTLSYKVITELLKDRMGFEGVVLTDDVAMKALSAIYEPRKLYVELLRAGNDMILGPVTLDYIDVIEQAVLSGDLPESRIDDACRRVLTLKERYGLLEHKMLVPPTEEEREAVRENIRTVSRDVAERGMTMTANRLNLIPLNRETVKKVNLVYIGYSDDCEKNLQCAVEEFARHGAECDYQVGFRPEDNATLKDYDLIVYATFIGMHMPPGGRAFFGEKCLMMRHIMTACVEKSVGVSFGDPDIFFNYFTAAPTFVNCYSYTPENAVAFVKGLYGEIPFGTHTPFPLNPITRDNDVY